MNRSASADRLAWLVLAFGLIAPWWLPLQSQPIPTFYKEWLAVLALAIGGLSLGPPFTGRRGLSIRHPLILAVFAIGLVLLVQSVAIEGAWRRASLTACALGFFAFSVLLGSDMRRRRGDESTSWLAGCLVIAACGSCVFAAMQLGGFSTPFPLVLGRSPDQRIYGNVGQANHFAALLWVGCVGAVLLFAQRKLRLMSAAVIVVALLAFSVFSGSRMLWVYVAMIATLGIVCWFRGTQPGARRFAVGLIAVAALYVLISSALAWSGALERFNVTSAERRLGGASGAESTTLRIWLWRAGVDAAISNPMLGVGIGRFPGHAFELATRVADAPPDAADANAHNVFIHLAAELGVPLALLVAICLGSWLVAASRRSKWAIERIALLLMIGLILVHANLELPLWYMYFLGLLGILIGHVSESNETPSADEGRKSQTILRVCAGCVLLFAILIYAEYRQLESAMSALLAQVRVGAPPQPGAALNLRLSSIPRWSSFGDYVEAIDLITSLPAQGTATTLAERCQRAVRTGPTPYLLARCATVLEVAGQRERATQLANGLCKLYPRFDRVLAQSMAFVERQSPAAGELRSSCVSHVN